MVYLTVHDLVWINNIITGKVNTYDYVTLEATMAGQYSYGDSRDVPAQAAILMDQLLKKAPFREGNRRTALIATLSFLNANGFATAVADAEAAQLFRETASRSRQAQQAIEVLAAPAHEALPADTTLRKLITHECNAHVDALKLLAADD